MAKENVANVENIDDFILDFLDKRKDRLPITGLHVNGLFPTTYSEKKVLLAGGFYDHVCIRDTYIYNTESQSFVKGPDLPSRRKDTALCYLEGKNAVLSSGGHNMHFQAIGYEATNACYIYSSEFENFKECGKMLYPRSGHRAVHLRGDNVFMHGGCNGKDAPYGLFEIFNTTYGSSRAVDALHCTRRYLHGAAMLNDGRIFLCGGRYARRGSHNMASNLTDLYDPCSGTFTLGPYMPSYMEYATATMLTNGDVLVVGQVGSFLFDYRMMQFRSGPDLTKRRKRHFTAKLPDEKVMIGGGDALHSKTYEIYNERTQKFETTPSPEMPDNLYDYTAACLF